MVLKKRIIFVDWNPRKVLFWGKVLFYFSGGLQLEELFGDLVPGFTSFMLF